MTPSGRQLALLAAGCAMLLLLGASFAGVAGLAYAGQLGAAWDWLGEHRTPIAFVAVLLVMAINPGPWPYLFRRPNLEALLNAGMGAMLCSQGYDCWYKATNDDGYVVGFVYFVVGLGNIVTAIRRAPEVSGGPTPNQAPVPPALPPPIEVGTLTGLPAVPDPVGTNTGRTDDQADE